MKHGNAEYGNVEYGNVEHGNTEYRNAEYEDVKYKGGKHESEKCESGKYESMKYENVKQERKHESVKLESARHESVKHESMKEESQKHENMKKESAKCKSMRCESVKYLIVGNSAAGIGAVEGIRQVDKHGGITIVSREPHHTYSRPLISYLLMGKTTEEKMKYRDDNFYERLGCRVLLGKAVTEVRHDVKQAVLDDKSVIRYDKILIATGSGPFIPPFEGLSSVGDIFTFMSLDDARKLGAALGKNKRALIVGAGLIGIKCAEGILEKVRSVTVVDIAPRVLSSILDEYGAKLIQRHLESKGVKFRLSAGLKSFDGKCAILENGDRLAFDLLVIAAGVRPNTALLSGLAEIDGGIVVNDKSETTARDIYAAGDCTKTLDISSGQKRIMALLPNAYMQGECAGVNMAGGEMSFDKAIPMNAIGFFGKHVITAGTYSGEVYTGIEEDGYKCLFYSDNRLNGYILVGNVERAGIYTSLIRERTPLDSIDFELVCRKPGLMAFAREVRKWKLGGVAS